MPPCHSETEVRTPSQSIAIIQEGQPQKLGQRPVEPRHLSHLPELVDEWWDEPTANPTVVGENPAATVFLCHTKTHCSWPPAT
jgi:hypothetical protein